jgi:hypothetical protein
VTCPRRRQADGFEITFGIRKNDAALMAPRFALQQTQKIPAGWRWRSGRLLYIGSMGIQVDGAAQARFENKAGGHIA